MPRQSTSGDALGALQWSNRWLQAHDELALLSLNANTARSSALTAATQAMVDYLRQGIGLTTPTNVNVVSESASLPVTVTNSLPYRSHCASRRVPIQWRSSPPVLST